MKNKLFLIMAAAAIWLAAGKQCLAQSLTGTNGVLTVAAQWVSNINTNYSYADLILWNGALYQNNVNIADELGASYDLWHSVNTPNNMDGCLFIAPEGRFRNAGIGGVIVSGNGGLELGYMKGDFRAFGFGDFAYLQDPEALNATSHEAWEFGFQADKMLSADGTAAGLFVSMQEHQKSPIIGLNLNVTFGTIGGLLSNL